MSTRVSLGDVNWMADDIELVHFPQPLPRYGTDAEVARSQRQGVTPYTVGTLHELGIIPDANDIRGMELLTGYVFSQGCTSRIPNFLGLPEWVINQASMTNDENITGDNAAKERGVWETSAVGSSVGEQAYYAEGLRFYQLNQSTGAKAVASCNVDGAGASVTLPGTVILLRELTVAGSRVLAMSLRNYGVVYTADPDAATVVWTTYIAGGSSCHIDGMKALQTIGGGRNVFKGKINGTNGFWHVPWSESAPATPERVFDANTLDVEAAQGPLMASAIRTGTSSSDNTDGGTAWTNPTNADALDSTDTVATNTPGDGLTQWLVTAFDFSADNIPDDAIIEGLLLYFQAGGTGFSTNLLMHEICWRLDGVQVGFRRNHGQMRTTAPLADNGYVFGGPDDTSGAILTGADINTGTLSSALRIGNTSGSNATPTVDCVRAQVIWRESGVARTLAGPFIPTVFTTETAGVSVGQDNPENVWSDDGLEAAGNSSNSNGDLWGGWVKPGDIPDDVELEELLFVQQVREAAQANNAADSNFQLWLDGALVGGSIHFAAEWGAGTTTAQYRLYRFTPQQATMAAPLTVNDLPRLMVNWEASSGGASQRFIDLFNLYVTYRDRRGTMLSLPTGSIQINDDPSKPTTISLLSPPADEETTYTLPLEQWDVTFFWNAQLETVTMAVSQPNEGLVNTHHAIPLLSGVLFTGGLTPGPGTELFFRDEGGLLYDYRFPKKYGTYTPRICWLIPVSGQWAALGVVMLNSSGTVVDFQVWYFNGETLRYYADTPLTSVTDHPSSGNMTISALPIYYGTVAINPLLSYIYTVFPNSTDTAVRREHIHTDLGADPRLDNPAWVKQARFVSGTENARLQTRLARMNFGPTDALKDLTEIYLESVQVDNNTSYGTVNVKVDSEGDTTLATPNVENTFTAGNTTYQVPNALAYNDLIVQIEIGHEAGSAETPNALPIVFNTEQSWTPLAVYRTKTTLRNIKQTGYDSIRSFRDALIAQNETKQTQRFTAVIDGTAGVKPARFLQIDDAHGRPRTPLLLDMDVPFYVVIKEVEGALS